MIYGEGNVILTVCKRSCRKANIKYVAPVDRRYGDTSVESTAMVNMLLVSTLTL
jgi:hypothetical protein